MEIMRESSKYIRIPKESIGKAIDSLIGEVTVIIPVNRVGKLLEFNNALERERAYEILQKIDV